MCKAKKNSKRRGLNHNEVLPNIFATIEKPIKHHMNNDDVCYIPQDLHLLYYAGHDSEKHRENLLPIIIQLYPEINTKIKESDITFR